MVTGKLILHKVVEGLNQKKYKAVVLRRGQQVAARREDLEDRGGRTGVGRQGWGGE